VGGQISRWNPLKRSDLYQIHQEKRGESLGNEKPDSYFASKIIFEDLKRGRVGNFR